MEGETEAKISLFASNARTIKEEFGRQKFLTVRLAALFYTQEKKTADCTAIRQCYDMIRGRTGAFSAFRGNMSLCFAALLSLSDKPARLFSETLHVYDLLKSVKFRTSEFLVAAAYQIASGADSDRYSTVVERTRAFYEGIKRCHRFHTGQSDYIYAAMLGLSDYDVNTGVEHIERIYAQLNGKFWGKSNAKALSQVLVLGGISEETVSRLFILRDILIQGNNLSLLSLGILSIAPADIDVIIRDIIEAQAFLRTQKGFRSPFNNEQELSLFTAALVAWEYKDVIKRDVIVAALLTSIIGISIAQQADVAVG